MCNALKMETLASKVKGVGKIWPNVDKAWWGKTFRPNPFYPFRNLNLMGFAWAIVGKWRGSNGAGNKRKRGKFKKKKVTTFKKQNRE